MKRRIIIFLGLSLHLAALNAQNDSLMRRIAIPSTNPDWIRFRPDANLNPLMVFPNNKTAFGLGTNDEMKLLKTETDNIGFTHYRFQQFYRNFRVVGGDFILHLKNGILHSGNGKLIRGMDKTSMISISKEMALQLAMGSFPAESYAWQVPELERDKKLREHNNAATYYPLGELVWISRERYDWKDPEGYELAYAFDITTAQLNAKRIFVHAANGSIVTKLDLEYHCNGASVTSNFNGTVNFSTRLVATNPDNYNLWNDCQTAFIHTRQWAMNLANATEYNSANNTWTAFASAATSHWGTERSFVYFLDVHGRNGWNNANGGINIYQDALFCYTDGCVPTDPSNASFSNGVMLVGNNGNNNAIDDWNSLDIIAHEFTHGVTSSSAGLPYKKETGALNESFSDIFGVSCYAWFNGLNADKWKIGFDMKNPSNPSSSLYIRNMANPSEFSHPDTYGGTNWFDTNGIDSTDNWGVHRNSGVQNYMYYLLVTGGSGTNDNGTAFSVGPIGIVNARQIAYRALTVYLTANSDHYDARNAWVHAAADIFGDCSYYAIQTGRAWHAVGIDPPLTGVDQYACGDYGWFVSNYQTSGTYWLGLNCYMNVVTTGNLTEFAGNRVVMSPGFRASNGSRFRAYPSECRFSTY